MLYMLAMVQPILPLIEYNVNKEYIASVLCENRDKPQLDCQGKCYLKKQIQKTKKSDSHEHPIPQIDLSKYPVSLISNYTYKLNEVIIIPDNNFQEKSVKTNHYSASLFRPPIV